MKFIGLFNPLGTNRCFGIPVFEDDGCYYTQVLGDTNLIAGFEPCSLPKIHLTPLETPHDVSIGWPGVFAFFFSSSEITYGSKDQVRQALVTRLSEFLSRPFLKYEIADFLNDANARDDASQRCLEAIFKSALEILPEDLRKPNKVPMVVNLVAQNYGLPPSEAVKQMDERLSQEKRAWLDLKLPRFPEAKKDQLANENQRLVKDGIEIEIDTLRARLIEVLHDFTEIWDTCQEEIAEIEPISDIYRVFRDWHKEDGLQALASRLSQCRSYETLRRYNHPLLEIEKLAARLDEPDPDAETIEQLVCTLLNGESKPGGKRITGRLTRALMYIFPKLGEFLEGLTWNNAADFLTTMERRHILRAAEQLVANLPGGQQQPHFRVQDLSWRAVLLDKAGERSQAAKRAKDALQYAESLPPGPNLYMWWSRLGDANCIVAKASGDPMHPGWMQCGVHYQQALNVSDEGGKIMLYIRYAEALADQVAMMFGTNPTLETARKICSIAIRGCEMAREAAKRAGGDSIAPLFMEARLRASLASALEIAMPNHATVAVAEHEFEMAVEAVLQRNPRHTGAIWLAWRFHIEKGDEYSAFQWLDEQVKKLRKTNDERSWKIADYLEFQAACYMADLGQLDEARQRFQIMVTTTQPNNVDARRELFRIGLDPSQEDLAQQLYKKAYRQPVGSQDRKDRAAEALNKNQPLVNADPDKQDAIPWTRHARLLLLMDETDKAFGILEELLAKYPRDPYVWFHLGEAHYRQGADNETKGSSSRAQESYAHATAALQKAWEITPRVDTAHRLAACWARRRNIEEAKRMLLEAEKLDPEDGWTKFSLGRIYYQSGYRDEALRLWIAALQCFAESEEQMDQRRMGLAKQAANAIVRFAEEPTVTEVHLENLGSSALRMLASAASSAGWNRSRIVENMGSRLDSLPLLARRRVPHALRAHLLYLQLAEGNEAAYQWHKCWYQKLGAVDDPKLFFEYASGAKGAFRRAALWSLSALMNSAPHSLLGTPTAVLDEKRWGEFLRVVSTWSIRQNYYLDAYAAWPSDAVSCDELWAVVCRLNANLFHAALNERGLDLTPPNPANLLEGAKNLPLEFEMLPANELDPDAPASLLLQTDELFSHILLNRSKDIVDQYAVSEVKKSWDVSGNLLRSSFYDGAAVPPIEVESLRILASRGDVEVTTNENRGLNLAWVTSPLLEDVRHFA